MYTTVHTLTTRATTESSAVSKPSCLSLPANLDACFLDSAERTMTADINQTNVITRRQMGGRANS